MTRTKEHAEKPGSYELSIQIENTHLKRKEYLKAKIFISGYGIIENAKIHTNSQNRIFEEKVKWMHGFKKTDNNEVQQGTTEDEGTPSNVISLSAAVRTTENEIIKDVFSDEGPSGNQILSEIELPNPPLSFEYKIKKNAMPGKYYLIFTFTYFNGEKWITKKEKSEFSILNVFQSNEKIVSILALLAAITTIVSAAIVIGDKIIKTNQLGSQTDTLLHHRPLSVASCNASALLMQKP